MSTPASDPANATPAPGTSALGTSGTAVTSTPPANGGIAAPATDAGGATIDMASVLAKIQQLENDKKMLEQSLGQSNERLSKFQATKREEMKAIMESTINKWLEHLEATENFSKDNLKSGLERLVQEGNPTGVWDVIACASSNWQNNVNEIESLRTKLNSYEEKEKQLQNSGIFAREESRIDTHAGGKRKADDISPNVTRDIWGDLESMIMKQGGNDGKLLDGPSENAMFYQRLT